MRRILALLAALILAANLCAQNITQNADKRVLPPAKVTSGLIVEWNADDYAAGSWVDRVSGMTATNTVVAHQPSVGYFQGKKYVKFAEDQALWATGFRPYLNSSCTVILHGAIPSVFTGPSSGRYIFFKWTLGASVASWPTQGNMFCSEAGVSRSAIAAGNDPISDIQTSRGFFRSYQEFVLAVATPYNAANDFGIYAHSRWHLSGIGDMTDAGIKDMLTIGSHATGDTVYNFPGLAIRDIYIYNRVLSTSEIEDMLQQP